MNVDFKELDQLNLSPASQIIILICVMPLLYKKDGKEVKNIKISFDIIFSF